MTVCVYNTILKQRHTPGLLSVIEIPLLRPGSKKSTSHSPSPLPGWVEALEKQKYITKNNSP